MIVPDVNLLLYAHIDAFPEHDRARAWWEGLLNGDRAVGLPAPVVFGFLRISTNPRVIRPPVPVEVACTTVETWLARRHVRVLVPGPRHLEIALGLLRENGAAAGLTTDAQIAAHAIELGAEVHSNDGDFRRFSGLKWRNPLE